MIKYRKYLWHFLIIDFFYRIHMRNGIFIVVSDFDLSLRVFVYFIVWVYRFFKCKIFFPKEFLLELFLPVLNINRFY